MSRLADRLLAVDESLTAGGLQHAFGGAIALAYCTHEPRGTRDLDVNVFVGPDRADEVLDAMPAGVRVSRADRVALRRDGQVRVTWDDTPVDVFLNTDAFHEAVANDVRRVPFQDATIPVLGCDALVVFKALFDRTRDWADIEAILSDGGARGEDALRQLEAILGAKDAAVSRLASLVKGRDRRS
jgi:hypothetical protein